MKICGDAEIRLQEIFKEDILADQFWLDEANAAVEAVANYDSSEADSTTLHFYYINNRKTGAGLLGGLIMLILNAFEHYCMLF